jgi:branched-chain amino acid transport system substrate-binding protein
MGKAAAAWADSVNASGGINGHAVKMFVKDDSANPATSLQDVKELVEQDHVIAIVGEFSLADASWAPYVQAKGIPVVGGVSAEAPFLTNPDFFPSGAQIVVLTVGALAQAKAQGHHHVGVLYCAETPLCAQIVPLAAAGAKLSGLSTTAGKISGTAPSYTAPCLAMKQAGADALFVADNGPVVQRVAAACAQQGYKAGEVNYITSATRAWLNDPNLAGTGLSSLNANAFDASLPATKQMQDALAKYAGLPVSSSQFVAGVVSPWAGGKLFEAAAKAAKLTPTSTAADVKTGLYALKNETLGGLAPPLNFTPGRPAFVDCYFSQQIAGGKFVSGNNNKPTCLTAAQATALQKALGG